MLPDLSTETLQHSTPTMKRQVDLLRSASRICGLSTIGVLLVPEGSDGVKSRRLQGRPESEEQADACRHGKACCHGPERDPRRQARHQGSDGEAQKPTHGDSDEPTGAGERNGFQQELPGNVALARAHSLAHADLARRSVTDTSMMSITPMPPTSSPMEEITTITNPTVQIIWRNSVMRDSAVDTPKLSGSLGFT